MKSLKRLSEEQAVIQEREALIEMYKAGFLDGYCVTKKLNRKNKDWWIRMNKEYKKAFFTRFEKKINKELKKCT
ncbi:MAG: hypothetical protein WC499_04350 [Patescibacteria group bacterium]